MVPHERGLVAPAQGRRRGRLRRPRAVNTVIVGAGGHLGQALRREFPDAVALDRAAPEVTDAAAVEAFDWTGIDVVLNAAAWTAVDAAEDPANPRSSRGRRGAGVPRCRRGAGGIDEVVVASGGGNGRSARRSASRWSAVRIVRPRATARTTASSDHPASTRTHGMPPPRGVVPPPHYRRPGGLCRPYHPRTSGLRTEVTGSGPTSQVRPWQSRTVPGRVPGGTAPAGSGGKPVVGPRTGGRYSGPWIGIGRCSRRWRATGPTGPTRSPGA
ncbi:sugar nucleotide-binding protein [Blastococcus sp. SYSU DS0973]